MIHTRCVRPLSLFTHARAAEKAQSKKARKKQQQQQYQQQQMHQQQQQQQDELQHQQQPASRLPFSLGAPVFTPSFSVATPATPPAPLLSTPAPPPPVTTLLSFPPLPQQSQPRGPVTKPASTAPARAGTTLVPADPLTLAPMLSALPAIQSGTLRVLASVDDFFTDDNITDTSNIVIDPNAVVVPQAPPSYSQMARVGVAEGVAEGVDEDVEVVLSSIGEPLCPFYYESGQCPYGDTCAFVHGTQCPACQAWCVTPESQEAHEAECLQGIEDNAHRAHLSQQSAGLECGICYDVVLEKASTSERRYTVLQSYVFTQCVQIWRHVALQPHVLPAVHPQLAPPGHLLFPDNTQMPALPGRLALCRAEQVRCLPRV